MVETRAQTDWILANQIQMRIEYVGNGYGYGYAKHWFKPTYSGNQSQEHQCSYIKWTLIG